MRIARSLALSCIALCSVTAWSADLSKIDRTIGKEPAYKGKPRYCLLVFGAEAKHRAWLVLDDEAVYVDRNGSGDLTENGKRVPWKKVSVKGGDLSFEDGKVRYTNLTIEKRRWWTIEVSGKNRQRVNRDAEGQLAFAERPQDAPVIHFDAPLRMAMFSYCNGKTPVLVRGNKPDYLSASIGTPGLGKGTFAYLIPPKNAQAIKPLAELEFPHRDPKEKPIVVKVHMQIVDGDCLSFEAAVRVPDDAAGARARVALSFADWKEGAVAPGTFEVAINEPKPPAKPVTPPR